MKLLALGLALLLSALGSTTVRADNMQGITDTTIKIGNMGPYTGDASSFSALNYGPLAYFRYINSQGGVHGRKFEMVTADDACKETTGIAAAKKLIYQDKVFMILATPCSGVAMAIKPTLLEDGLPWIGVSANPKLTTPTVPNMFHVTYTGVYSGRAMAGFALSKPNTKKIVLVAHTNDWARGYCDPATELMKEKGVEPMMTLALERGSTDATAQALRIKSANADFVLGCLCEAELALLLRDAVLVEVTEEDGQLRLVRAAQHEVGIGRLDAEGLRGGVGRAPLEGERHHRLHTLLLHELRGGIAVAARPVVGVGDQDDLLGIRLRQRKAGHSPARIHAGVRDVEHVGHGGRGQLRVGGDADPRQPVFQERGLDGHGHTAARRDEDHEYLVLVDELLGRGDAGGLLARVVRGDELELAPMHAALAVDVAEVGQGPVIEGAEARRVARVRSQIADLDGGVGDPLRVVGAGRRRSQGREQQGESECEELHGHLRQRVVDSRGR